MKNNTMARFVERCVKDFEREIKMNCKQISVKEQTLMKIKINFFNSH